MRYSVHPKTGEKFSILGYGCMRFSRKGGSIDQEKAEQELIYAIQHGVNYFDTAYIYPGNEIALGKFLSKGWRSKVNIATKIPHYKIRTLADLERIFSEELERLQTDYIDFYLMHMLPGVETWERLKSLGVLAWLEQKKSEGVIRYLGFSYHGGTHNFKALIDAYDWDFCQIQYNYVDEFAQAGKEGLQYAYSKHIPVIIMEPLKGGRLANRLPEQALSIFRASGKQRSPAEWGLRWLWAQKEVFLLLSGMNHMNQLEENLRIASLPRQEMLEESDYPYFIRATEAIRKDTKIDCSACGYCTPCPAGVDIPVCFRCYNNLYAEGWYIGFKEYLMCTTLKPVLSSASQCIGCGKCEQHCPQGLSIRENLKKVRRKMETPLYHLIKHGARLLFKF